MKKNFQKEKDKMTMIENSTEKKIIIINHSKIINTKKIINIKVMDMVMEITVIGIKEMDLVRNLEIKKGMTDSKNTNDF